MKKFFLIAIATLSFAIAKKQTLAQSPEWLWAKVAEGTDHDAAACASTDASGNVYMTGSFDSPSITFGSMVLTNSGFTSSSDIFITKYDSNGTVLWAKSAGGSHYDYATSISTDKSGNVYVTGYFHSYFITFGSTVLTSAGVTDIFLTKYDSNGTVLWAKSAGGTNIDKGSSVSTDWEGNVYVTGEFQSHSIMFGSINLINLEFSDIFLVKYDSNGTVLWAKSAGGTDWDQSRSVTTDASGNVYITGTFCSDSIAFNSVILINAGDVLSCDIFTTKYDSNGNVLWAQSAGGSNDCMANSVSTDAVGNVYVSGEFYGTSITFGSITLTSVIGDYDDIFITKYDSNGTVVWAKSAEGIGHEYAIDLSTDSGGNLYVTGYFDSPSLIFGSITLQNADPDHLDIFITKYYSNGNSLWAKSAGGSFYDYATSISTDAGGNVYVTGMFFSDSITFGSITLHNAGYTDIFIAKLSPSIPTVIEGNDFIEKKNVFPNPFYSEAILQTSCLLHNATLTFNNVFGQTVKQVNNISGRTVILQRDNLPAGLYFIRLIENSETIATEKVVID